jgi:hypothetical protein
VSQNFIKTGQSIYEIANMYGFQSKYEQQFGMDYG